MREQEPQIPQTNPETFENQFVYQQAEEQTRTGFMERIRQSRLAVPLATVAAIGAGFAASGANAEKSSHNSIEFNKKTPSVSEKSIRWDTAEAVDKSMMDPATGARGTHLILEWVDRGLPDSFIVNPVSSTIKGSMKRGCPKPDSGDFYPGVLKDVKTQPRTNFRNPSIEAKKETVADMCERYYRDDKLLINSEKLKTNVDKLVGVEAAQALHIKPKKIGSVKLIKLAPQDKRAKIKYANIGNHSLKTISVKSSKKASKVKVNYYK